MSQKILVPFRVLYFKDTTKSSIYTICNKFSTKCYDEFNLVFVSFSPSRICVPVYSGKYLSDFNDKYLFHALYYGVKFNT